MHAATLPKGLKKPISRAPARGAQTLIRPLLRPSTMLLYCVCPIIRSSGLTTIAMRSRRISASMACCGGRSKALNNVRLDHHSDWPNCSGPRNVEQVSIVNTVRYLTPRIVTSIRYTPVVKMVVSEATLRIRLERHASCENTIQETLHSTAGIPKEALLRYVRQTV
ncbi:hypothetical protein BKA58DRAFT_9066 [Alternaria rosae]|uniref:uncharacterized protein n=1 Tax=Alternaria rosae TaxID=1187941 RepID=UPI001E8CB5BB|nr:uncharacterized protein BKA58DRAFT_9066 [Alternaria rosae]KAH6881834.1 hypothetical protein BKA58DRAFT_9066 [Alternaria rosae]